MSRHDLPSRRSVVALTVQLPVVGALGGLLGACGGGTATQCANPDELSFSENSIRKANNYTESSAESDKHCANCAFFTAATAGAEMPSCGHCEIFDGPANRDGYCDSWSAREEEPA